MFDNYEHRRVRSAYGKRIDKMYARREIGWAYYNKLCKKPKCWEYRTAMNP